ncbi:uncharacterized protein LOC122374618 [Amphibalanus amphitrite]|uniref:uncharacterized protein LOC122374618 n=1 Tax=Amphibalanus amphitrite TaxID=1232801 RepID=UPI001C91F69C|nr:uncharacterized protein LOC122374618 [Amphibalanus amphitrite]XP_043209391.1 uncharacterized protein LOC122374618 [Amphibalanus amphitrite]
MSFLDTSSQSGLLDCSEGEMKAAVWASADLLDPSGDASDFDISSFFSQLAASSAAVEASHGGEGLCEPSDVSGSHLAVHRDDNASLEDPVGQDEADVANDAADVSLSALLGEHAEIQEALLAASQPPPPPPAPIARGKTVVVVKRQPPSPPPSPSPPPPSSQPASQPTSLPSYLPIQRLSHPQPTSSQRPARRTRKVPPPYGRPPTAPLNAYCLFFKEQYAELKLRWRGLNTRRAIPKLSKLWASLGVEERRPYVEEAERQKGKYRVELAEYRRRARIWRKQRKPGDVAVDDGEDVTSVLLTSSSSSSGGATGSSSASTAAMATSTAAATAAVAVETDIPPSLVTAAVVGSQPTLPSMNALNGDSTMTQPEPLCGSISANIDVGESVCSTSIVAVEPAMGRLMSGVGESQEEEEEEDEEAHFDDDPADLFCSLCGLYFSSSHNKQQHLTSRGHIRKMEERALSQEARAASLRESRLRLLRESKEYCSDVTLSMESTLQAICLREREVGFLKEFSEELRKKQEGLKQQLAELEERRAAAMTSQEAVTSQHRQLTEQVENLLLIPTLFGVMKLWGRDTQRSAISVRCGQLEL